MSNLNSGVAKQRFTLSLCIASLFLFPAQYSLYGIIFSKIYMELVVIPIGLLILLMFFQLVQLRWLNQKEKLLLGLYYSTIFGVSVMIMYRIARISNYPLLSIAYFVIFFSITISIYMRLRKVNQNLESWWAISGLSIIFSLLIPILTTRMLELQWVMGLFITYSVIFIVITWKLGGFKKIAEPRYRVKSSRTLFPPSSRGFVILEHILTIYLILVFNISIVHAINPIDDLYLTLSWTFMIVIGVILSVKVLKTRSDLKLIVNILVVDACMLALRLFLVNFDGLDIIFKLKYLQLILVYIQQLL